MKYMKLGSKPDLFQTDGNNIRFVATELATDIIVNVGDVKFYLHKFPLLSKSTRLQKLVAAIDEETNDEIDIPDIPGGPAAFEICAKFCYGMVVTLNAYNVVAARCAAEYLEMHESLEKGNLIYKIEVFLNSSVFRSWKDSIIVLQTTKSLLPWSEDLKVISHCIDSIASKASIDPAEVGWSYTCNRRKLQSEIGVDAQWNGVRKQQSVPEDWWVEDLSELEIDSYKRVITAIRTKGRSAESVIGEALKVYTYRRIAGFGKGSITDGDVFRNRAMLETIVCLLPTESGSVSCSFLLKLLKAANLVSLGENCKKDLAKRIGRQLQEASLSDLLIPSSEVDGTVYDIDIVMSIVEEFVMQEHGSAQTSLHTSEELQEFRSPIFVAASTKLAVAELLDGYLAEIAKDPNLPLSKFIEVAEMEGSSRPSHDGLYRAIDTYLKEHPDLSKSEKKKICGLMDCKKLTADACSHAVQNERLPLRVVVQVLFFEQVRAAAPPAADVSDPSGSARSLLPRENGTSYGSSRSAATTNTDDDWDGVHIARGGGRSEQSSGTGNNANMAANVKVKGVLMPKKLLSKFWSSKSHRNENSSSDTSESPGGSTVPEESKSTPSRNTRHSVS